jgi:hypothetical protein
LPGSGPAFFLPAFFAVFFESNIMIKFLARTFAACVLVVIPDFAEAQNTHGAAAAGIQRRGSTTRVSVGTGGGDSTDVARRKAMDSCMKSEPRNFPCKIVSTWQFGGCGFIATGTGRKNSGLVGWGSGATREAARAKCMSNKGIVQCGKVIGFCSMTAAEAEATRRRIKGLEDEIDELEKLEKELDAEIERLEKAPGKSKGG